MVISVDIGKKRMMVRRVVIILIIVNFGLFFVKWIPTLISPSISVEADAFNSLGDFAYSGLFLLGFELLLRPKDESHPHGHERFEPFISLMVAGAISLTGILVVVHAVQSVSNPVYSFSPYLILALVASIMVKSWLAIYLRKKAGEVDSTALESSSKDAKVDVLASATALVGVIGAGIGFPLLDTVVGAVVSVWIFFTAFSIGRKSFRYLTGAVAPKEVTDKIREILDSREEVVSFHELEAHYVGPEIHVSLSIHLPKKLGFDRVHQIEEGLRREIGSIKGVDIVYLHLEPEEK